MLRCGLCNPHNGFSRRMFIGPYRSNLFKQHFNYDATTRSRYQILAIRYFHSHFVVRLTLAESRSALQILILRAWIEAARMPARISHSTLDKKPNAIVTSWMCSVLLMRTTIARRNSVTRWYYQLVQRAPFSTSKNMRTKVKC